MAKAEVSSCCVEMKISEISKLKKTSSPEILVYGVPWVVKICKVEKKGESEALLSVHLHCNIKTQSPNWSYVAIATFKLLPFADNVNAVEYHTSPRVYDLHRFGHGTSKFIRWNKLFDEANSYVKNDTIQLEVKVKAENPNDPHRSRLECEYITSQNGMKQLANFHLTAKNVENLMAIGSEEFKLCDLPWALQICKNNTSHLEVILQPKFKPQNVSCEVTMCAKLVSSTAAHSITKIATKQYRNSTDLLLMQVTSWDELVKAEKEFVNNGSIALDIELNSGKPDGNAVLHDAPNAQRAKVLHMECPICFEQIENQDLASTPCGHLFCFDCITNVVTNRAACPTCVNPAQLNELRRLYLPV